MKKAFIVYPTLYIFHYKRMIKISYGYKFISEDKRVRELPLERIVRVYYKEGYVEFVGLNEGSKFEYVKKRDWPTDSAFTQYKQKDGKVLTVNKKHVREVPVKQKEVHDV
jgi:hypothetical protein